MFLFQVKRKLKSSIDQFSVHSSVTVCVRSPGRNRKIALPEIIRVLRYLLEAVIRIILVNFSLLEGEYLQEYEIFFAVQHTGV